MRIDELKDMWEGDCEIDGNKLDTESLNTVKLHAKYLRLLIDAKMQHSAMDLKYRELRQNRFRYYRGELSQQELTDLGWPQYQGVKPIKNVMDELIEGDKLLNTLVIKKEYLETMIYFLESIMNGIKSRGWDIKNAISFKQFLAGV